MVGHHPMKKPVRELGGPALRYGKGPGRENQSHLDRPEVANRLLANLTSDIERGRSTDGPTAKNDLSNIRIWKSGRDGTTKKSSE